MSGFHAGGFEAAEEALRIKYESAKEDLLTKLRNSPIEQIAKRAQIEMEISCLEEAYRESLRALERSLF